jgi:hypothetical protein
VRACIKCVRETGWRRAPTLYLLYCPPCAGGPRGRAPPPRRADGDAPADEIFSLYMFACRVSVRALACANVRVTDCARACRELSRGLSPRIIAEDYRRGARTRRQPTTCARYIDRPIYYTYINNNYILKMEELKYILYITFV